jgi:hypothetical protein
MRVVAIMVHICSIGPDLTIDKWGTCHISFAMDSSDVSSCIYKLGYAQICTLPINPSGFNSVRNMNPGLQLLLTNGNAKPSCIFNIWYI